MDLKSENFRAMIYYDFQRGLSQKQCIDQLTSTFGDIAPSNTTAYHWFSGFNRRRSKFTDELKEGPSKSVVVPQNIDAERDLIIQDRHVTYREIKNLPGHNVFVEIRKNNRQRRIILHHDNASCNTSAEATRFLEVHSVRGFNTLSPPCRLSALYKLLTHDVPDAVTESGTNNVSKT
ncbi:hypothetical protein EVAR_59748_1 [Eumeta japonica]|uniref:Mos1 transposase HTH domain-containing protein n=1 Tax=Eumeta variegata TaxID=151549 RepID=A0A4C1Z3W3_EUMVA|nr:hypothetical protein EVAR_59748_1 [Eumeta japonica]